MGNLLQAESYKLWRNKSFWGIMTFSLFLGSVMTLDNNLPASAVQSFDAALYNTPLLYFLIIIFSALFIGGDFDERTIHAYISAGHKRSSILLAKAISYFGACILILMAPILFDTIVGWAISGEISKSSMATLLVKGLVVMLAVCAMGSLPFLAAFVFKDLGQTLAVPLVIYFLMIFALNSEGFQGVAVFLPIGQIRLLSLNRLPTSYQFIILIDILWIALCYIGAYLSFFHWDLK
jgi:ABC-type transport system involved in multi-copper enzyme maturation permease subunit